ncbi:Isopenicillin N synthase [Parasponia andersonii]|uniref:Isopenicillin N synthase n=1 Tax=Parasponia andersonii TaxID=3476 RepID=A0A2P5CIY3_PARAD|nr:Isopenicillin N synthase [Parasponia andersonii]
MVIMLMMQQQQASSALASHPINPSSTATATTTTAISATTTTNNNNNNNSSCSNNHNNSVSLRSPTATPTQSQLPTPLSLAPLSSPGPAAHRSQPSADHAIGPHLPSHPSTEPVPVAMAASPLARVRLSEIALYDGAPAAPYLRAVDALSGSLMRHNAAVIELGSEDAALMRCGLEAARLYFRTRAQQGGGKGGRGVYMYRAGRPLEDWDSSPPCMADIFRCMGKASRAALCAIARHLRLRSDVFNHLLDDMPLPANEVSSSVLVASYSNASMPNVKGTTGGGKPGINGEIEKGLLTLFSSDTPGLQVCDPNGRWYLADSGSSPGDLLLLTGKALSHTTAGLRPAASYRAAPEYLGNNSSGRTSLAFRLMPQGNAVLDCSPIAAAGHVIPQSYVPISVSQFMDDLSAEEDILCSRSDNNYISRSNLNTDPSLRSVLSDPLSGAFLEDATFVSCGHSFGGLMLRRVIEMSRCTVCSQEIETGSLIPNIALRAAAAAVKHEDNRRLFHNAALRKRRKELGDQMDSMRRPNRENGDVGDDGLHRGVQYPFSVNEKVVIKGNRRTPEKFVGKDAVITSQCLNGWYLLKILESGENVRLQYRSLRKIQSPFVSEERCSSQPVQNSKS